jgi:hypothetical protein
MIQSEAAEQPWRTCRNMQFKTRDADTGGRLFIFPYSPVLFGVRIEHDLVPEAER